MQEFELTFYFKGNAAVFQSHRTFEFEFYTHIAVIPLPGHEWEHEQPGSEGYQIFVSRACSHATFLQENFVFAKHPVPMTARSRSLFQTNAHSNVKVGLRSQHEKIIAQVKAH